MLPTIKVQFIGTKKMERGSESSEKVWKADMWCGNYS